MVVGIMSMQKIHNYGSFLQAYALKKIIESMGHKVVFVDYHFEKSLVMKKESFLNKIIRNINILKFIKKRLMSKKYNKRFDQEFIPFLYSDNGNEKIEFLVIGSDEVFNCLQEYPVGYSRELFGYHYENIPVISYAASFGQTNYEKLKEYGIEKGIGNLLKNFQSISVRDKNSFETIKKLTDIEPVYNLDPVLIYDYSEYINNFDDIDIDNYIILYAYPGRLTNQEEKCIKKFAKNHNKKIVSFGMYQKISDLEIVVSPFEIFKYFKKADFIITDTFHGSIFSIKTHSNFVTLIRNNSSGNANKLFDLLSRLELKNRIINSIEDLEYFYKTPAKFDKADKIIVNEQKKAKKYLKNNIKESD